MAPSKLTENLVDYIIAFDNGAIPNEVIEYSKLVILDTIGAMIAATNPSYSAGRVIIDYVREQSGKEEASVVGGGFKAPAPYAALANGTLAYLCDIENYHVKAILHETAVVLPVSLAIAEKNGLSGIEVLVSFILGLDLETRISYAISPTGMYSRGFHPTVVAGCLGAAISAGKLLGLGKLMLANTIGLAASQSSGLLSWESDITEMSRPFGCGLAARNGVMAALLGEKGFGGPEVLEGKYTIFDAFSGEAHTEELLTGLGNRFEVMNLAFKRHSSCAFTHPGLDALLILISKHSLDARDIERIRVKFPSRGAKLIDRSELRSHNIQFVLSLAAYKGQVMYDDILFNQDEEIIELSNRIELIHDKDLDPIFPKLMPTIVEVTTYDGNILEERIDSAKGTPENPMTPKEIRDKFYNLTVYDEERAKELDRTVKRLDKMQDISELTDLLRFKSKS
jgi:2-methylcitrate dehydratase PrpD